ncbi:MAG: hypothetical protein QM778_23355 [Myxococcales bacterium]
MLLPIASLAFAVLARPQFENRAFTKSLDEVTAFQAGFDRPAVEQLLRDYAQGQGMLPLDTVSAKAAFDGKSLGVAAGTQPIRPLTVVSIATLSDAQLHGRPESSLRIGVPDVSALGAALSWRLNEHKPEAVPSLKAVTLSTAAVSESDVALELEVAALQKERAAAEAAVAAAAQRLQAETDLFDARRKRGLAWKIIVKSIEARDAAKVVLDEKTAALADVAGRYEAAVKRALAPREKTPLTEVPQVALARVDLEGSAGSFEIPVRLEIRTVPVPPLRQADFAETTQAGLWDKVKGLDPQQAVSAVRDEFNWHNRYVEVAGIRLGGMTLLQILPCLLPVLMLLLRRRLRAAAASYSLFGTRVYGSMPTVGFKSRSLEGLALILLPLVACASAALALVLIGQPPVLPVLSALVSLMLGTGAFVKVGELQGLVASVVQSHSYPPPDPHN